MAQPQEHDSPSRGAGGTRRKASVVVPVYYNEQSLQALFEELLRVQDHLDELGLDFELIFVDDGSGDQSLGELMKIKQRRPSTKVVKLTRNFGAVHASKTGALFVTGDCYMNLAADLQDPPELIIEMVRLWLAGSKYVVCARKDREDPVSSKVIGWFYYRLVRLFVIPEYPATGYDLALLDRSLLPFMQNSSKNVNPLIFSYWLGFKPHVLYYTRRQRKFGKSRWTLAKKVTFFLDSILGFSILPIRLMSFMGVIVSFASFAYGGWISVNAFLGRMEVRGFATIVSLIALLLGIVMIMLGIIGEYTWRIFDEINKRPEAVIDEIY